MQQLGRAVKRPPSKIGNAGISHYEESMDDADIAQGHEERDRAVALRRRHATLPAVGQCYSCAEPVEGSLRFCDRDCLDDYERSEKARRMNGRME
jgi:hypothetical protein